ncbi:MAG: site-specific integrase [Bacteroidales bacterium]|nr:site-specific integrase [Bacteroidales bacterium]
MNSITLKTLNSEIVYCLDNGCKIRSGISFSSNLTPENLLSLPLETIKQIQADMDFLSQNPCAADFYARNKQMSVFDFFLTEINRQRDNGKLRTAEIYASSMRRFRKYLGKDIPFSNLTGKMIKSYEAYLAESGLTQNTVGFYMRVLRTIYNKAVAKGIVDRSDIFKGVYTGVSKTKKRALPLDKIQKIKDLDLSAKPKTEFARDVFMFGFYCRGMSLVDIAALKKTDIKDGVLTYIRRKTGRQISIKLEPPIMEIINKHLSSNKYLLPIIKDENAAFRPQLLSASHTINAALKSIGETLGLPIPLTMYVSRHTWASLANTHNIPLAVISKCLGHSNQLVTQIYLDEINDEETDKANETVINLL